jgi:outer membrane receptor for ferrienterochelin and colicin
LAYTNTGAFKTEGLDAQIDWSLDLKEAGIGVPGRFGVNTVVNYLFTLKSTPFFSGVPTASQTPYREYAGTSLAPDAGLSANGAFRWKTFTTFSYSLDNVNIGLQWQHLPKLASGTTNTGSPAYDLFSLSGSVKVTNSASLRVGVDNLFDKAPPLTGRNPNPVYPATQGGAVSTGNYDAIGRRFYIGVTTKF